jgi:uncharacterized protein (DUF1501 family)
MAISRRSFLTGAGGLMLAGGGFAAGRLQSDPARPTAAPSSSLPKASTTSSPITMPASTMPPTMSAPDTTMAAISDVSKRRLVVVELGGGNDGLSTLIPYSNGRFQQLRANIAIPDDQLIRWDDDWAVHANLKRLNDRGIAMLQGIGSAKPDGSHFAMQARWYAGMPDSDDPLETGFFGRLCDALGDPAAPFVGVCIGSGSHPALNSSKVATMGLPSADAAWYLTGADEGDVIRRQYQAALASFAAGSGDGVLGEARRTLGQAIGASERLRQLDEPIEYPSSALAQGLSLAARILSAESDTRIIYVPSHLGWDTHTNHSYDHPANLAVVDEALDAFLNDIGQRGLSDQVLVATTSEFGRRLEANGDNGLDHGAASTAMLFGPISGGVYGESPSLDDLDDDGNLRATASFDRYYATLAESWFGVPAGDVLPTGATPLDGISF